MPDPAVAWWRSGGPVRQSERRSSVVLGWLLPIALFGVALWLRLYRLGVQPLWLDEGQTWARVTGSPIADLIAALFRPTDAYPLYHLLLKPIVRLLGDSEWALRLPSAIAGALAVPAIYVLGRELRGWIVGLAGAALLLLSPFALWQAQDAKAYSLVLLAAIGVALALAHVIRRGRTIDWLVFALVALIAPFVHRLLIFTLIGAAIGWAIALPPESQRSARRRNLRRLVLLAAIIAGVVLVLGLGLAQDVQSAANQFAWVGPIQAAWLTFGQFSIGQWPGAVRKLWLLPWALLTIIGAVRLLLDVWRGDRGAWLLLAFGGVPTLLFAALLAWRPFYETRYLTIVFPFWLLLLAWGVGGQPSAAIRQPIAQWRSVRAIGAAGSWLLILGSLIVAVWALRLPNKGLWSGDIVKEDYRGMVRRLADHVHPDDLVIVHPDSVVALYTYYGRRVSDHPLPEPTTIYELGRAQGFDRKELERTLVPTLQKFRRAWLLIAPAHAAVIDPPIAPGDEFGLIGLAFQYGDLNRRWLCGTPNADKSYDASVGVKLYCNAMPDYGQIQPPEIQQPITFGDRVHFLGYTLHPFANGVHPGGTLPITLYWSPTESLAGSDYRMFVHLTTPDNPRPLAQIDAPPLEGGLPTALWTKPNDTIHDERAIKLTNIETGEPIPPGRYVLRLGVWDANAGGQRLKATDTDQPMIDDAVVIGEVEITPPEAAR